MAPSSNSCSAGHTALNCSAASRRPAHPFLGAAAGQNRLLALNYVRQGEDPEVCAEHEAWGRRFASRLCALPPEDDGAAAAAPAMGIDGPIDECEADSRARAPSVPSVCLSGPSAMDQPDGNGGASGCRRTQGPEGPAVPEDAGSAEAPRLPVGPSPPPRDRCRDRPLVVGYVSPDLFTHSVSYFAEAPLTHHRPEHVRLIVYSCVAIVRCHTLKRIVLNKEFFLDLKVVLRLLQLQYSARTRRFSGLLLKSARRLQHATAWPRASKFWRASARGGDTPRGMLALLCELAPCLPQADAKTERLRKAAEACGGVWRDVASTSEADLARMVRHDRVDILVELTGHTANNRLGALAMRPAPIQV
jgi:hypothetical protein